MVTYCLTLKITVSRVELTLRNKISRKKLRKAISREIISIKILLIIRFVKNVYCNKLTVRDQTCTASHFFWEKSSHERQSQVKEKMSKS